MVEVVYEAPGRKAAPCFAQSTPSPADEEPSVPRRHSSSGTATGITAQTLIGITDANLSWEDRAPKSPRGLRYVGTGTISWDADSRPGCWRGTDTSRGLSAPPELSHPAGSTSPQPDAGERRGDLPAAAQSPQRWASNLEMQ